MSYLQTLSLLLTYLKYTNHLDVHGIVVIIPLVIDFLVKVTLGSIVVNPSLIKGKSDEL